MAMAEQIPVPHHRKRKRRRQDKSAISARLVLDDHVKGDVGTLSEDLFADLFPAIAQGWIISLLKMKTIANRYDLQPKQTATALPILLKSITSQFALGDRRIPSKIQHGQLSQSERQVPWHIRLYNSLPHLLLSKSSPRPFKRYLHRNYQVTVEVALKSGYWMWFLYLSRLYL